MAYRCRHEVAIRAISAGPFELSDPRCDHPLWEIRDISVEYESGLLVAADTKLFATDGEKWFKIIETPISEGVWCHLEEVLLPQFQRRRFELALNSSNRA